MTYHSVTIEGEWERSSPTDWSDTRAIRNGLAKYRIEAEFVMRRKRRRKGGHHYNFGPFKATVIVRADSSIRGPQKRHQIAIRAKNILEAWLQDNSCRPPKLKIERTRTRVRRVDYTYAQTYG